MGVLTWRMTSAKLIASSMPGMDPARSAKKEPSSSPAASLAFSGLGSTSYVHNQAILSTPQTSFSSEEVSHKRQGKALIVSCTDERTQCTASTAGPKSSRLPWCWPVA